MIRFSRISIKLSRPPRELLVVGIVKDFDYKIRKVNSRHVPAFRIVCKECSCVIDP